MGVLRSLARGVFGGYSEQVSAKVGSKVDNKVQVGLWREAYEAAIKEGKISSSCRFEANERTGSIKLSGLSDKEAKFLKEAIADTTVDLKNSFGKKERGFLSWACNSMFFEQRKVGISLDPAHNKDDASFLVKLKAAIAEGDIPSESFKFKQQRDGTFSCEFKFSGGRDYEKGMDAIRQASGGHTGLVRELS